jgi:hypothetical protein
MKQIISTRSTRQRLLDLMLARVGRGSLAVRLAVPLAILDDWSCGAATMPDAKLVALIDFVDETSEAEATLADR